LNRCALVVNQQNGQIDKVMMHLTGLTLILLPICVVPAAFGMNVRVPGMVGHIDDSTFKMFSFIVAGSALWCILGGLILKKIKAI